eukprot:scaffold33993_cov66-Attheya_sp.AAC.1
METRTDSIDAKVADVELDMQVYMGTRNTLQKPVPPDEYYKFALPAGASANASSYVDHTIPLPAGTHATNSNDNPDDQDIRREDHCSKLLLPHDSNGQINNTNYCYNVCLSRLYHSFGHTILAAFTTKQIITSSLSPKAYSILLSNKNIHNGWDLLWNILRKRAHHLGGTNLNHVHDMITNLNVEPGESLAIFCNRSLQIQHTIVYSQTMIPET